MVESARKEGGILASLLTHRTRPNLAPGYSTHRTHRMQSQAQQSQDATVAHLMQYILLLMGVVG